MRPARAPSFLLALLLTTPALAAAAHVYSGGYGRPGAFTLTILDLVETPEGTSGKMRQPDDRKDQPPLTNVKVQGDRLAFDAAEVRFELKRTAEGFHGTARAGGKRQDAWFVRRPGAVAPDTLATYEGSYALGRGRIVTFSRNNAGSGFWYLDLPSGRTGFLFNLSDREFIAGPCIYCAGPEYLRVTFAGGRAAIRTGGRTYDAARLSTYREEEVTFTSRDGTLLAGSLFLPAGSSAHGAVVFAHGSNAQSRNGFYGHIRFLAEAYARKGVAALAFDKRGTGKSKGDWEKAGFATLADDVAAGVRYLQSRADIRADRIGLVGSSQAGWIMPMAATRVPDVRFIQHFSAASPLGVREQERRRLELQMQAENYPRAEIDRALRIRDLMDDYTVTGEKWEELQAAAGAVENEYWMKQFIGGLPAKDAADWAWLREAFRYDTTPDFAAFRGSWQVLYGDRDVIAPIKEGRAALEKALASGESKDITIEVIPHATHNFLEARTGSDREFSGLTRFVPHIHDKIVDWAVQRVQTPAR